MKKNVISSKNLRFRSPLSLILLLYLCLDNWSAPQWVWGAVGLLCIMFIIVFIIDIYNTNEVDIFDNDNDNQSHIKTFKERLKEKIYK